MTGLVRLHALVIAVRYAIQADIPGAFAECGVWRGGSVFAIAATLKQLGVTNRDIYLYDTFDGMTEPTDADTSFFDGSALERWNAAVDQGERMWPQWFSPDVFSETAVRDVLRASGYPDERLHFIRGRVEDTLPEQAPEQLALLRLDTDWYQSTLHEMVHLYPRLALGGVLMVDDYGHWEGARRAVDEYFADRGETVLLGRVDHTCRQVVKR
ncbi:class I SAM-dependent methyltransferase [Streptomyces lunaelactis]|nr:class I SAM-dependent methyltransferase [Streptomyces lunaelactis]